MDDEIAVCQHGVARRHGCKECIRGTLAESDTGEIAMTPAEYAAFRERAHAAFRTPGWEAPELRALGEDD